MNAAPSRLREAASGLLDALFPPKCAACGVLLPAADQPSARLELCVPCAQTLEPIVHGCERCGLTLEAPASGGTTHGCSVCIDQDLHWDRATAVFEYGGAIAELLHRYKYEDHPAMASALGSVVAAALGEPVDVVTHVPLHWRRRTRRGFDQAELLGRAVARESGVPFEACLERTRVTSRQVGRTRDERLANLEGAFRAAGNVEGRCVALVDDVVTTGATSMECARVLRKAGATRVLVLSVARAV